MLLAFVVSLPLGYLVYRTGRAANLLLALIGVIYSIPSLALFVAMPLMLGTKILNPLNVAVALAVYSSALLVRSVVDGLRSVPLAVEQSASAIGYGWLRRLFGVELPLAMPVIFAGLRVVTVSNIALVSVAAVVGGGALGQLFDRGLSSAFYTPIIVGLVLSLLLALLADGLILLIQRGTLPWARGGEPHERATGRRAGRERTGTPVNIFSYLLDPANWGPNGIITKLLLQHLAYTIVGGADRRGDRHPARHRGRPHRSRAFLVVGSATRPGPSRASVCWCSRCWRWARVRVRSSASSRFSPCRRSSPLRRPGSRTQTRRRFTPPGRSG